jgi:hypothetical protein
MAVHIFTMASPQQNTHLLNIIAGYEDGSVALYSRDADQGTKSIEGIGWNLIWRIRDHLESGHTAQIFWISAFDGPCSDGTGYFSK